MPLWPSVVFNGVHHRQILGEGARIGASPSNDSPHDTFPRHLEGLALRLMYLVSTQAGGTRRLQAPFSLLVRGVSVSNSSAQLLSVSLRPFASSCM